MHIPILTLHGQNGNMEAEILALDPLEEFICQMPLSSWALCW